MTSQQRKEYEVKSLTWETQKMESRTSHPNPTRARQGAFLQNVHGHALVHSVFYVIRCEHGVIQPLTVHPKHPKRSKQTLGGAGV